MPGKWSRYYLVNSYYIGWGRYVYGKKNLQIAKPKMLLNAVKNTVDKAVAIPAFHDACLRYLYSTDRYELTPVWRLMRPEAEVVKKAVPVKFRDGETVILDYYAAEDGDSVFGIFPHSLDKRYTKEDYDRILAVAERYEGLKSAYIFLFSLHRFSDSIVHAVARNDVRYAVTMERLKY